MQAYLRRILEQAVFERDRTPPEEQRAQRVHRDLQISKVPLPLTTTPAAFRDRHRVTICWSNSKASDQVLIRRALCMPTAQRLADAVAAFGLAALEHQWESLLAAEDPDALDARRFTGLFIAGARAVRGE